MSGPGRDAKVALVTGGGSVAPGWGIGKACCVAFARAGLRVAVVDVNREAAEETAALVRAEGGEAIALAADVSDEAAVAAMAQAALAHFGRVDVLHNNVGIGKVGGPTEIGLDDWNRIHATNVTSLLLTARAFLPGMTQRASGVILTTASVAAIRYVGYPHLAYGVTKAAAIHFTRMVALQYAAQGVRAVSLVPGLMDTPRIAQTVGRQFGADPARAGAARAAQVPLGYMGNAWDVAHAAVFLASDAARYITGTELVIDGGLTAKYS
jgi:NAD(P)-dependent dehydrogenase (short-subunit alcohol dehydrogenase family)